MRMIAALLAAVLASSGSTLCTLRDPRITEASGLGIGRLHPDVLYVQNDSGDVARFFAVTAASGVTRAVLSVPGARNVDWEDLAVARVGGRARIFLADIGDNDAVRPEVAIYRVDEPATLRSGTTSVPALWRLRYPDGPVNAEALAVAPGGAAYVVTKSPDGRSEVYRVPARPDPTRVQPLVPLAPFRPDGVGALRRSVTGASFSADGTVFALRTYTDAYLWRVRHGDLAAALAGAPVRLALPPQPQGEGIAVDTDRLLIDSEGLGSTVLAVPLPATFRSGTPTVTAPPSGTSTTGASSAAPVARPAPRRPGWGLGLAVVAAAGVILRLALLLRRRRRR